MYDAKCREWYCIIGNTDNRVNGLAYMETIFGYLVYNGSWACKAVSAAFPLFANLPR